MWTGAECGRATLLHTISTGGYRQLLTVIHSYRRASTITGVLPVVIKPIIPVATVWTTPLAGPTLLDALTRKLLDQTVNFSEGSPVCTEPWSTEPVFPSMRSGSVFSTSGKSPGIEEMLKRLISVVVGPESAPRPAVTDGGLRQQMSPSLSRTDGLAMVFLLRSVGPLFPSCCHDGRWNTEMVSTGQFGQREHQDSLSREMTNDPGGGSASRISHTSRPTDPGGGSSAASNEKSEPVFGFCPQGTPKNTGGVRMNNLAHRWAVNRFIN